MTYLKSFAPWIVYAVLSSPSNWGTAAVIAAVVGAGVLLSELRQRRDADLLAIAGIAFFAVIALIATSDPDAGIRSFTSALSMATMAVVAAGSALAGRPFTMTFAKRSVPEHLWSTPGFLRTNAVITGVWAACFAGMAVATGAISAVDRNATAAIAIAEVIGFAIAIRFTDRYATRKRTAAGAR